MSIQLIFWKREFFHNVPLANVSNKETFVSDFPGILKHPLQNFWKIRTNMIPFYIRAVIE